MYNSLHITPRLRTAAVLLALELTAFLHRRALLLISSGITTTRQNAEPKRAAGRSQKCTSSRPRARSTSRSASLLLALLLVNGCAAFAPSTKAELQNAVDAWVSDPNSAEATYGHISNWITSAITDMSATCRSCSKG